MKHFPSIPILCICLMFASCATMVSKENYPVPISSTPTGAKFTVFDEGGDYVTEGITPSTIPLSAKDG